MPEIKPETVKGELFVPPHQRVAKASVTLKGFSMPRGVEIENPTPIAGGYALNHDIDADFMEEWLKQNTQNALVKEGLIFVATKGSSASAQAKEQAAIKSNLEPLTGAEDRRAPSAPGMKIEKAA
jgi:hypothetical protein